MNGGYHISRLPSYHFEHLISRIIWQSRNINGYIPIKTWSSLFPFRAKIGTFLFNFLLTNNFSLKISPSTNPRKARESPNFCIDPASLFSFYISCALTPGALGPIVPCSVRTSRIGLFGPFISKAEGFFSFPLN